MPPVKPYPLYMLFGSMHSSWRSLLAPHQGLVDQIETQVVGAPGTTPEPHLIMRAFENPLESVKVLLIGQDPYPTAGVACGLAFAVSKGSRQPQSLKNLMKELHFDLPQATNSGDIERWNDQGVMLLNSALTTAIGRPGAHAKIWKSFTEVVIRYLDTESAGRLVCLSLGEHAKKLSAGVVLGQTIQATHPSPLSASRGFFGSRIYSKVNEALQAKGLAPIDWSC